MRSWKALVLLAKVLPLCPGRSGGCSWAGMPQGAPLGRRRARCSARCLRCPSCTRQGARSHVQHPIPRHGCCKVPGQIPSCPQPPLPAPGSQRGQGVSAGSRDALQETPSLPPGGMLLAACSPAADPQQEASLQTQPHSLSPGESCWSGAQSLASQEQGRAGVVPASPSCPSRPADTLLPAGTPPPLLHKRPWGRLQSPPCLSNGPAARDAPERPCTRKGHQGREGRFWAACSHPKLDGDWARRLLPTASGVVGPGGSSRTGLCS